jgi:acetyl esterase/lipase
MSPSRHRFAVALVAAATMSSVLGPEPAGAVLTLAAAAEPVVAPVAAPLSADPAGAVSGTLVMIHAGGWAGHDAWAQSQLMQRPGALFARRGWRVVSIDHHAGTPGLQDVLDAAGSELARRSGSGPLCLYGESSGGHLALVAASRLRAIRCVIAVGAPTDLPLYGDEAAAGADPLVKLVAHQVTRFFGTTLPELARWNPVDLAPSIDADVMLMHERDDPIVSASHASRMQSVRPTTEVVALEAGDHAARFIHGTVSGAGQARYASAIEAFADRAVTARRAERAAARTRCAHASRSLREVGLRRLEAALRCLARRRPPSRRARAARWTVTRVAMRGEINAARVWSTLRATRNAPEALSALGRGRATITIRLAERSQITVLRASPGRRAG